MGILKDSGYVNIGLYNLEPHIVNTAMMQVSQYHKNRGDNIYIYIAHCFTIFMIRSMHSVYSISHQRNMSERIW